jgi:hypothetical protein
MANNGARYTAKQKLAHVKAFRASGETQTAYCERTGVSRMTLVKWMAAVDQAAKSGKRKRAATNAAKPPGEQVVVLLTLDTLKLLQHRLEAAAPGASGRATVDLTTAELAMLSYALVNLTGLALRSPG